MKSPGRGLLWPVKSFLMKKQSKILKNIININVNVNVHRDKNDW